LAQHPSALALREIRTLHDARDLGGWRADSNVIAASLEVVEQQGGARPLFEVTQEFETLASQCGTTQLQLIAKSGDVGTFIADA